MKKLLLTAIFICLLLQTYAQNDRKVQSTQSISIGLVGVGYSYEQAIADKFSVIGRVGVDGAGGYRNTDFWGISESYWFYSFHPSVGAEGRYYYNLQKRAEKGKSIDGNTGSFLAVNCGYLFKPIAKHNVDEKFSGFGASSYWGLRRIWNKHILFEFYAGLDFGWNNYYNNYNESKIGVRLGVLFGYKF